MDPQLVRHWASSQEDRLDEVLDKMDEWCDPTPQVENPIIRPRHTQARNPIIRPEKKPAFGSIEEAFHTNLYGAIHPGGEWEEYVVSGHRAPSHALPQFRRMGGRFY